MMFVTRNAHRRADWCTDMLQPGDSAWTAVDLLLPAPFFVVDAAKKSNGTLQNCIALHRDTEELVAALQQPEFTVLYLGMATPFSSQDDFCWHLLPITKIVRRKRIPRYAETPYVFVAQDGTHYCDRGTRLSNGRPAPGKVLWTLPPSPIVSMTKHSG